MLPLEQIISKILSFTSQFCSWACFIECFCVIYLNRKETEMNCGVYRKQDASLLITVNNECGILIDYGLKIVGLY